MNKVISKIEAKRRGYIKDENGNYRKSTVLEKYLKEGYLHLPNSTFSDEDRKRVGERLAYDYYMGNFGRIRSVNIAEIRTGTRGSEGLDNSLVFRERFLRAAQSIPYEFWPYVRQVCIDNKEIKGDLSIPQKGLRNKNSIYYKKMLLNLGLERLVKHYLQKNKKSS